MTNAKRAFLAVAIGLMSAAPITYAQSGGGYQQRSQTGGGDISQQQLEKYAQAQEKVMNISRRHSQRLEGVQDRDKAVELQQQAQQQMVEAVKSTGLTVEEYRQITEKAQSDPEFRDRLLKELQ